MSIHDHYERNATKIASDGLKTELIIGSKKRILCQDHEYCAPPSLHAPSTSAGREVLTAADKKGSFEIHVEHLTSTPSEAQTVSELCQSKKNQLLRTHAVDKTNRFIPDVKDHFRAIPDSDADYFVLTAPPGVKSHRLKSKRILRPRAVPTKTSNDHDVYLQVAPRPSALPDDTGNDACWSRSLVATFGSLVYGTCLGPVKIRMKPSMRSIRACCAGDGEFFNPKQSLCHEETRRWPGYSSSTASPNASTEFPTPSTPQDHGRSSFSTCHLKPPPRPPPRSSLFNDSESADKRIPYLPVE